MAEGSWEGFYSYEGAGYVKEEWLLGFQHGSEQSRRYNEARKRAARNPTTRQQGRLVARRHVARTNLTTYNTSWTPFQQRPNK